MALVNVAGFDSHGFLRGIDVSEAGGQGLAEAGVAVLHHDEVAVGAGFKGLYKRNDFLREGVDFLSCFQLNEISTRLRILFSFRSLICMISPSSNVLL